MLKPKCFNDWVHPCCKDHLFSKGKLLFLFRTVELQVVFVSTHQFLAKLSMFTGFIKMERRAVNKVCFSLESFESRTALITLKTFTQKIVNLYSLQDWKFINLIFEYDKAYCTSALARLAAYFLSDLKWKM